MGVENCNESQCDFYTALDGKGTCRSINDYIFVYWKIRSFMVGNGPEGSLQSESDGHERNHDFVIDGVEMNEKKWWDRVSGIHRDLRSCLLPNHAKGNKPSKEKLTQFIQRHNNPFKGR